MNAPATPLPAATLLLRWILPLAFAARVAFSLLFGNLGNANYWEYGEIAHNLITGKGYSLFYLLNSKIDIYYQEQVLPYPSAYVPPGYTLFITAFSYIGNVWWRNLLLHLVQHAASLLSIWLLFRITARLFSERAALWAAALYAFTPELLFASASYGPTVFYQCVILAIVWRMLNFSGTTASTFRLAALFALSLYLRSEATVWLALIALLWLWRRQWKHTLLLILITEALLLPWQVRNYRVFGEFIPFTTSDGINLYRGHNPHGIGEWGWAENVYTHTSELCSDNKFELRFSAMYRHLALDYLRTHPGTELVNCATKTGHLWLLQPYDERALHPLYLVPWLITLALALWGLRFRFSFREQYPLLLFVLACTITAILFFALPRYQTIMKTALLPYAGYTLAILAARFKKSSRT